MTGEKEEGERSEGLMRWRIINRLNELLITSCLLHTARVKPRHRDSKRHERFIRAELRAIVK